VLDVGINAGVAGRKAQAGVDCARLDDEAEPVGGGERATTDRARNHTPGFHVSGIRSLRAGEGNEPDPDEASRDGARPQDEGRAADACGRRVVV